MSIKNLDSQILELSRRYDKLYVQYSEIQEKLENLEDEKEDLSNEMDNIENRLKILKEKMLKEKSENLDITTDDKFTLDFIKASYFTSKGEDASLKFQVVNITDTELQAVDGYKAIIINSNDIPDELKNTTIKWDTRTNFKDGIIKLDEPFIDLKSIFRCKEEFTEKIYNLNSEKFYSELKVKEVPEIHVDIMTPKNNTALFRKEYLDVALISLKGQNFNVYYINENSPLFFESDSIKIIVLPVKKIN